MVGENLAQDARCAAVGNRVMSSPTSAMITWAAVMPTPGIVSRRATAAAKGAISSSIRVSTSVMSAAPASIRASILVSRNAWWSLNRPTNASSSWLILARIRARANCAKTFGSRWPAIIAAIIARPETGEDVRCHDRQLDLGVLQQLLHPLLLRRPYAHQVDPVARQVPQHPDRWRGHEAGTQHLPLGDLAQPDGIELVRLGPTWQVFDVLGVDQPGLEPGRLQQVERRFPVVAGCLHHHPGHPNLAQPVAHPQQRPRHRRIGRHFLQSLAGGLAVRNPDTTDQLRLADVERRDPLDDLLVVLRRFQHCRVPPHARRCTVGPAARGSCKGTGESRSRARSNKEGPNGAAPSARLLNDLEDQGIATSTGGRTPIFSPERAARQGDRRLLTESAHFERPADGVPPLLGGSFEARGL